MQKRLLVGLLIVLMALAGCGQDGDDDDQAADDDHADDDVDDDVDDDDIADDDISDDDIAPEPTLFGIYEIFGSDEAYGDFTGQAEIRQSVDGKGAVFVRLIQYTDAYFEDDEIAAAWHGTVEGDLGGFSASLELDRIGFMTHYEDFERDLEQADPLVVNAGFAPDGEGAFAGSFQGGNILQTEETWTYLSPSDTDPLWQNERRLVATHGPPPEGLKDFLFFLFSSFHARDEVEPFVDREDFQAAVHYVISDPTDFDYYRENPGVLRVIQKVIDPVSLAETRQRARAYGMTLAEKAAYFDQDMHDNHLNGAGFIANSYLVDDDLVYDADMSSMLWTGVYIGSQAMRYLSTGEGEALDHVVECVQGQILAYDIVPEVGQFARSVRVHDEDMPGDWVRGTGEYSGYDYKPGGNNDMLSGYEIGFFFANLALPEVAQHDALRADMVRVLDELEQFNEDAGDGMIHEMLFNMLLYYLTYEQPYKQRYQQLLNFFAFDFWLETLGNASFYIYGISDWSGNHLCIQTMIVATWLAEILEDPSLPELQRGCRHTYWIMHGPRLPLFLNTMPALGWDEPPAEMVEEGLWRLREFRCPKQHLDIDWRINPQFCYSPFPELPWKLDWATGDRLSSLYGYPYFEQGSGHFDYRGSPFRGYQDSATDVSEISAEFLYAYWFLITQGIIGGEE